MMPEMKLAIVVGSSFVAVIGVGVIVTIFQMVHFNKAMKTFREGTERLEAQSLIDIENHKLWEQSYRNWRKGTILCPPLKP